MGTATDLAKAMGDMFGELADNAPLRYLDTGYPPLNEILSGRSDGGLVYGRMYEMFGESSTGKTALATKWMVEAQRLGGVAVFVDWERSFNIDMAKSLGLNVDRPYFIRFRPRTWEEGNVQATKVAKLIRQSGAIAPTAPIVVVFDSIAAAIPQSQAEKEIDEYTMNDTTALARVTSTTLKAQAQHAEDLDAIFLYLNQMRLKPGVCVRYDTPILLADGRWEKIGKVVHSREPVPVVTVDVETGEVQVRPIDQFHRNAHDGKWVHVETEGGRNGRRSVFFTPEHQISTPQGWKRADEIVVGDKINTVDFRYYSDEQHEIIFGSLLGDGQIRFGDGKRPSAAKGRLRMVHGHRQREYLAWKAKQLGMTVRDTAYHCYVDSASSQEFEQYRGVEKFKALLNVPQQFVERITPRVAAIWFMDDGSYSAKSGGLKYGEGRYTIAAKKLSQDNLEAIALHMQKIGLGLPRAKAGVGLVWGGEAAAEFGRAISAYVPECMSYKLNRKLTAGGDHVACVAPRLVVYSSVVKAVEHRQDDATKAINAYKYDIGVGDTHTFIAGGMVVHNCYGDPRTTPGGKAMEFYASGRLALGRQKIMEKTGNDKEFVGQQISIQCVKSKFTKPFKECSLRLMFDDDGIASFDTVFSLIEHLIDKGLLTYSKPRLTWKDGKQYFVKAFAEKVRAEGLFEELVALLPT